MESNVELKPCPFCGGKASIYVSPFSGRVTAWCTNKGCGVNPFTCYTKEIDKAVSYWNRRISDGK